jgi:pyruvate dehydrogenase E1 component alpha subunit
MPPRYDRKDAGFRILTPDGTMTDHADFPLDVTADDLRAMYRDLVLARRIDTECVALQRQGQLGLWTSALGQEAAQIGSAHALHDDDFVFPSYREHGVAMVRGVDPLRLVAQFRGVSGPTWEPKEHNFAPYQLVLGTQTLHAAGYAMGVQRDGADTAVVVYFGDGAASQGDVAEAFTWAAVHNLPVVFFCQNNQWAISTPTELQHRAPIFQRAAGFGFPGVRVDGNDVLACRAVTARALRDARNGNGPTLIEAFTYRLNGHSTSDDPTKYRHDDEVEHWRALDPIVRLRAHLAAQGLATEELIASTDTAADDIAAYVRRGTLEMPNPDPVSMFDNVYTDVPADLADQKDELSQYLASFVDARSH